MGLESLKPLIHWFHDHPTLGGLITCLISLLESLAIIGYLIPGSLIMPAIGALVGAGILPFYETMLWAILGAALGDGMSYWLGRHYHEEIRNLWPFTRYPYLIDKGQQFFEQHGGKSVFIGRFVGPVRPMVPLVAGMMYMPRLKFFIANVSSGFLWAPAYLAPGVVLGLASLELPPEIATRFLLLLVTTLTLLWLTAWLLKKLGHAIAHLWRKMLTAATRALSNYRLPNHFFNRINPTQDPSATQQLSLCIFLTMTVTAFFILATQYVPDSASLPINQTLFNTFRGLRSPTLDNILFYFSMLGDKKLLGIFSAGLLLAFLLKGAYRLATFWALTCVLAVAAVAGLKPLFAVARPPGLLHGPTSYSFPSGHTTLAFALYGFLIFWLSDKMPYRLGRQLTQTAAGFITAAILISRLYFGVHWFTDILGGALLGSSIAIFTTICYRSNHPTRVFRPTVLHTSCALICLLCLVPITAKLFNYTVSYYTPVWPMQTMSTMHWWEEAGEKKPVYRNSRAGKPVELINIQWLGPLNVIERELEAKGWTKPEGSRVIQLLSKLSKEGGFPLPLIPQLYDDHPPKLIMVKYLDNDDLVLVLRLWPSNLTMKSTTYPLWYGALGYNGLSKQLYLNRKQKDLIHLNNFPAPVRHLSPDLDNFTWKRVHYKIPASVPLLETHKSTGLLIKPGLLTPSE